MTKSQRARLARDYASCFSEEWKLKSDTFWRRSGEWIEYIQLRGSPHLPQYQFVHSFDYLLDKAELMMAYLVQPIRLPEVGAGPLIVDVKDHSRRIEEVFGLMVNQLRPSPLLPLDEMVIVEQLKEQKSSWHAQIGLVLFYANRGELENALEIRDTFVGSFRDRLGPRFAIANAEVERVIGLARISLRDLRAELRGVEIRHLQELRMNGFEVEVS